MGHRARRYGLFLLLFSFLLLGTGCVRVIGEVNVDWRANLEIGVKSTMPPGLYRIVQPMIHKAMQENEEIHIEEIEENGARGFRWTSTLEELQPQLDKLNSIPFLNKEEAIKVDVSDYWLFKAVDINAQLDLSSLPLPKFLNALVKPSFELIMPIYTKNNADQTEGNRLIWNLSLSKPNHIWIHVWVPNMINLLIAAFIFLLCVIGLIILWRRKRGK